MKIRRGLDIPISGRPSSEVDGGKQVTEVALIADDYVGMKPTMLVKEGDRVKLGQPLFEDKKAPGVLFTSPGAGEVVAVNRGEKRRFLSVIVRLEGDAAETFPSYDLNRLDTISRDEVVSLLVSSGAWTSFRTRPWSRVPAIDAQPHSIFVTAIDTRPLAADPEPIIAEKRDSFLAGLKLLTKLTSGKVYVCAKAGAKVPGEGVNGVQVEEFAGPHPAGLPGTHIHFLDPVGPKKTVWHLNYQDLIAMGDLALTGQLSTERVISLAGPLVSKPRLLRTRVGAKLSELVSGEFNSDNARVISGSVLGGRKSVDPAGYLGRYSLQVTVLEEGNQREFLGWQGPGFNRFSITKAFASAMTPGKLFAMSTSTGGSKRAMVPIGVYERVMPLDMLPTQLLRSLITKDTEQAQLLGCLELDEEDLALCTFVCPGKYEYGTILRENLTQIEKEG
ncbi:MAG: Na(+)-translocating NADH-quinone reductase subunit A [Planctomycetales bacterium]|nr:Na(+)-translocating NADH-quinone reductase subunit A [Planctomycetales bacterium]